MPAINRMMNKAKLLTDPEERAKAWAEADRMITAQAPAIPYVWDKNTDIASSNVNAVVDENNATWSLSFTSLK